MLGAAGYADDIILMAPSRTAMQIMLKNREKYATDPELVFSTDPDPRRSKTKCLYMTGTLKLVCWSLLWLHAMELFQ